MNYVGKKVKHSIFGTEEIISQDEGNRVGVRFFDCSVKEFVAPKCFETFLVLQGPSARAEAKIHLAEHEKREKAEAEIKKKEAWERSLNKDAERKNGRRPGDGKCKQLAGAKAPAEGQRNQNEGRQADRKYLSWLYILEVERRMDGKAGR